MIPVAIMGGSGYTGVELMRLIAGHPELELVAVSSAQFKGQPVDTVFGALEGAVDLSFVDHDAKALAKEADLVFLAVPHKAAMAAAPALLEAGAKVVDLSADFRIHDAAVYEKWYAPHTAPQLLAEAVYGLPEFYREQVKPARLVANPGCYVTSVLVPLVPLLKAGLVEAEGLIADSASGVSGAGRSAKLNLIHGEVHENFKAYAVDGHRHTPEMEQELSLAAGQEVRLTFTPHLLPMDRGILSTVYARPKAGADAEAVRACWQEAYGSEPFVRVLPGGRLPATKEVRGTNRVQLGVAVDPRSGLIKLFSALDNLTKGASGQAMQNANLMLGLDETAGLRELGLTP
ncbi:MAG: N-acetyl-gamma-glutamyl-phosphate reductase [Desulfarculus sp.]|nr:N-acetyl-gamma-glutamyl-phosphate reductase [Pseudomonadota bacterium]MBV1715440.1 N-acetyl-gamma-glutamyl-phosphate reductase [Desulfarculus sp.]MBU4575504.1 N-acetyl-gamma-glutamyl-phosphate reductase [Pseudomonadota bacterium]MBU4596213.1 N-acetyl-gamma-glutamyl-phosphate reductase [Pseudomonadota bacterium]MBV1737635.1 N-acetyl-gamma-glutamyl-phosphate reductase [Desulfarculus sp.]